MVFVGVWLSLLAENWRQNRSDSLTARASFERMAQDLESDLADMQVNLDRAETGVIHGRWLLSRAASPDAPADSVTRALSAIQFCSSFIENRGEYEALRNSGRLGIIADADLRRRVVALYEARSFIHDVHATDCQVNEAVFGLVAPRAVMAEPPYAAGLGQVAPDGLVDSSRPRVIAVPARAELMRDSGFLSRLTELVTYRSFLSARIQDQIRDAAALREDLLGRLR